MKAWVVTNYAGRPLEVWTEQDKCLNRIIELNNALNPWERMAGYYYGWTECLLNCKHDENQSACQSSGSV